MMIRQIPRMTQDQRVLLRRAAIVMIIVTVHLVMVYGNWTIVDAPESDAITIGTSYMRYWLPIFVMTIPLVAYGMITIQQLLIRKRMERLIPWFTMSVILASVGFVLLSPREGLLAMESTLTTGRDVVSSVVSITPDNAVILVRSYDKWIFGLRRVIVWDKEPEKVLAVLPFLGKNNRIYVLMGPEETILHPWQEGVIRNGIVAGPETTLPYGFSLLELTVALPVSKEQSVSTLNSPRSTTSRSSLDTKRVPLYWFLRIKLRACQAILMGRKILGSKKLKSANPPPTR